MSEVSLYLEAQVLGALACEEAVCERLLRVEG
jgi:hypothetical protein